MNEEPETLAPQGPASAAPADEPISAILAEMREALADLVENIEIRARAFGIFSIVDKKTWLDAKAALSAPPRNCDRFDTVDEARREFQKIRGHKVWADIELWDDMDEVGAFVRWLFAPAKENGGNK